ncbi:homeobox protein ceh-30 [Aphelenchoides avenae]|nr:homeobox protein ceh-30 [Aphelenchus avenae]
MSSSKIPAQAACRKVSEVWDHFTKDGSNVVRCNICQRTFNHHRTTGTYWHHLMYRHETAYKASNYYKAGVANGKERHRNAQTPRKEHKETPARFSFTDRQRKLLELSFAQNNYVSLEKRARLAKKFGVGETSIRNWFLARRHQEKRRSLQDGPTANEHEAKEAEAHQDARDGNANAAPITQADNEPQAALDANDVTAASAVTPDADSDDEPSPPHALAQLDLLRNLQCQMMPPAVYHPQQMGLQQRLPAPVQQASDLADDLVETSGRSMVLRLTKLYEKDPKLFLRAQNDANNAIFEYEMKATDE